MDAVPPVEPFALRRSASSRRVSMTWPCRAVTSLTANPGQPLRKMCRDRRRRATGGWRGILEYVHRIVRVSYCALEVVEVRVPTRAFAAGGCSRLSGDHR